MPKFEIVRSTLPVKRRAPPPLSDDPLARAKSRYISSRVTLVELAEEFKGMPGCSLTTLGVLSAKEGWVEDRERFRDRTVTTTVEALGADEVKRSTEHLRMTRNTLTTTEGILSGIHTEVGRVLADQAAKRITATHAVDLLRALASAARNIAMAQGFGITLEQRLGQTEGSGFQRLADAAENQYQQVIAKRNELVKRAEDLAAKLEAEKREKRGRKAK